MERSTPEVASYITSIESVSPDRKRLFAEGSLARNAIAFIPHYHAAGFSIALALFFSTVGVLGLRQAAETYEQTRSPIAGVIAALGLVGLFVGVKQALEAYRGVVRKRREQRGFVEYGIRLDENGLVARPARKDHMDDVLDLPRDVIRSVSVVRTGGGSPSNQYATTDDYAKFQLESDVSVMLYIKFYVGRPEDVVKTIQEWLRL